MSANVLVPLDGSLLAERALPVAASLVKQRHGRLELALVHEPIAFEGFVDAPWNAMTESMQDRYVVDKAAELSRACDSAVTHTLLHGDIAKELCKRAREMNADVIVMSTHGRTGLARAFAGSVADEEVRNSQYTGKGCALKPADCHHKHDEENCTGCQQGAGHQQPGSS